MKIELNNGHRLVLLHTIQSNNYCTVSAARWQQGEDIQVAVKTVTPSLKNIDSKTFSLIVHEIEKEAYWLKKLNSRKLLRFYMFAYHEQYPILVTEYLQGTLQTLLAQYFLSDATPVIRLDFADIVGLVLNLAAGLDNLHAHGLKHLDIKPANVFLTQPNNLGFYFKLGDLGSIAAVDEMCFRGTPQWFAPEYEYSQAGVHTDYFGVGLVLFYLLTGKIFSANGTVNDATQHYLGFTAEDETILNNYFPPWLEINILQRSKLICLVRQLLQADYWRRIGEYKNLTSLCQDFLL